MKKAAKKFLAIFMAVLMVFTFSTVAFADGEADEELLRTTYYVNASGYFQQSTGPISNLNNMSSGSYTLYYSVGRTCTLRMWMDSWTCYNVCTLSGYGSMTITVPFPRVYRGWELYESPGIQSDLTYSITITD